jgi:hypothetical protein
MNTPIAREQSVAIRNEAAVIEPFSMIDPKSMLVIDIVFSPLF